MPAGGPNVLLQASIREAYAEGASLVALTERRAPETMLDRIRVAWLGLPLFTVPALLVVFGRDQQGDILVHGVAEIVVVGLILTRIVLSARDQEHDRRKARAAEAENPDALRCTS